MDWVPGPLQDCLITGGGTAYSSIRLAKLLSNITSEFVTTYIKLLAKNRYRYGFKYFVGRTPSCSTKEGLKCIFRKKLKPTQFIQPSLCRRMDSRNVMCHLIWNNIWNIHFRVQPSSLFNIFSIICHVHYK